MSLYETVPLPDGGRSIRLLHIKPGRLPKENIRCELCVAELGPELQYEALSYTWGDPLQTSTIVVNEIELNITASLANALFALRSQTETRILWIDQICINQQDLAEKSFQIPLMAPIYRGCTQTVIWLGDSDKTSREVIKRMNARMYADPSALSLFLTRPWFRRIWIVQELALAPKATIQCGSDILPWQILSERLFAFTDNKGRTDLVLSRVVNSARSQMDASGSSANPVFYAAVLNVARKRIQKGALFSLREALRCFQAFDATLVLDKVYGLLSLVEDSDRVEVDYKLSSRELFMKTSIHILNSTGDLRLFMDCLHTTEDTHSKDLPSWVPDWSTSAPLGDSVLTALTRDKFHASRGTTVKHLSVRGDGSLRLRGQYLGAIAALGKPIPPMSGLQHDTKNRYSLRNMLHFIPLAVEVFKSWRKTVTHQDNHYVALTDAYFTAETLLELFYQIIPATGGPSPDLKEETVFRLWIEIQEAIFSYARLNAPVMSLLAHTSPWIWHFLWPFYFPVVFTAGWCFGIFLTVKFGIPVLRYRVRFGKQHDDPGRQSWVIGSMDCGLLGRFPAPGLSAEFTLPARVGDSVFLLKGGSRPFVLRRVADKWRLVGDAYVHGIMFGGAFREVECVNIELI